MRCLFTGDLVVDQSYNAINKIDNKLIDLFSQSELNIINLESPVTNNTSKILKTGPNLKSNRESTTSVLKALCIDVVTLANNHILDYDEQGVSDTLEFCQENEIQAVGAGMNLKDASETLYINTAGGKIAILNFAENEWSSANENTAGAHPMDIIDNARQIQEAKLQADFVFVIVHGGHEYYNLPSPRMQKQYRFYAEQGADIVIGHHTHCINGHETHKGVPIFYSLGNFLFTRNSHYADWYTGLVLEVEIRDGKLHPQLHPIQQEKEFFRFSLLTGEEKNKVMERIEGYNTIIADESKLSAAWKQYIETSRSKYLNYWSPLSFIRNRYVKALFRKAGLRGINRKGLALYLNLMRCEAHRDLSKEILRGYLKR